MTTQRPPYVTAQDWDIEWQTEPIFAADVNNWAAAYGTSATGIRISASGQVNMTGMVAEAGAVVALNNVGAYPIIFKNQSASSTAANRFAFALGDITLAAGQSFALAYDPVGLRWCALDDHGISHLQLHSDSDHTGANRHSILLRSSIIGTEMQTDFRNSMEVVNTFGTKNELRPPPYVLNFGGTAGATFSGVGMGTTRATASAVANQALRVYLGAFTMVRFTMGMQAAFVSSGTGYVFPQWSADGTTWTSSNSSATSGQFEASASPATALDLDGSVAGAKDSAWVSLNANACQANGTSGGFELGVWIRWAYYGTGTGIANAQVRQAVVSFL